MTLDSLDKYKDWGPLVLRIIAGGIFIWAGWDKLSQLLGLKENMVVGMFDGLGIPAALTAVWLVALIELIGGIMVVLGWNIRWAAAPLTVAMVVAIVTMTAANGFLAMNTWAAWYAFAISFYFLVCGAGPKALSE